MEIIKNGKDKEYTITCSICDSDLVYKLDDIYTELIKCNPFGVSVNNMTEYVQYNKREYIICPVCKKQIRL